MTKQENEKKIPLSAEDLAHMRRLRKEVATHLEEMRLIVEKTLGRKIEGPLSITLKPAKAGTHKGASPLIQQPNMITRFGDPGNEGCYEDPPGVCFSCPEE